jgi:hypothetical protein
MTDIEWFYCWNCGLEFGDRYAEKRDGRLLAKCPCGATVEKEISGGVSA